MKRVSLFLFFALLSIGLLQANPVDVASAKAMAQKFAVSALGLVPTELNLVYSASNDRGEDCFYAFNIGQSGFVIVSADDFFRPIVGYSDEGVFETENMSPELAFYLDMLVKGRSISRIDRQSAEVAAEWDAIRKNGRLISYNGGKRAEYLVKLKWNQNYPYNYYCPPASSGPGGRVYAGCVATAMSMIMKYWDYPTCGQGSHTHIGQTINFGETTYDWANMPNSISSSSTQEQIDAVAILMYHCGMAVDMNYSANGSGAYSQDVPDAVRNYFLYGQDVEHRNRDSYSLEDWQNMLKESFDKLWPVYYSGCSESGCHAFVCDGYNDNDLFHYNWGWSGSGNGWYVIDGINYHYNAAAIFNFVPYTVYNNAPQTPSDFSVSANGDLDFSATLSWTNPTATVLDSVISTIDKIVVSRNGEIVYEVEDATPGMAMSYTDHCGLPATVNYSIYAVCQDVKSEESYAKNIFLGSSCQWTVNTEAVSGGWRGGTLSFFNAEGICFGKVTSSASGTQSWPVNVPKGQIYFSWQAPSASTTLSFSILDSESHPVFAFSGNSDDMPEGIFYELSNSCGFEDACDAPFNAVVVPNGDDAVLSWDGYAPTGYGFAIYRDGKLYAMARNGNSFADEGAAGTSYCYKVSSLCENGESAFSNECVLPPSDDCVAPSDFYFEILDNGKVKLHWTKPDAENLSGYLIYRKDGDNEYQRIKLLGATATSYSDLRELPLGQRCRYKIFAYYQSIDCESSPARSLKNPHLDFVELNNTIIPSRLSAAVENGMAMLSWDDALSAESYTVYRNGEVVATGVLSTEYSDPIPNSDWTCYSVTGVFHNVESSPSNSACVSLTAVDEGTLPDILVYPNPTSGVLNVEGEGSMVVSVFNIFGQEVLRKVSDSFTVTLDLSHLSKGTYFVKTMSDKGSTTHKVALN